jgi:two-component system nitrogen regulation response regulator GlnG
VLQSGTFERVGGNQSVKVNVRVIAATNKPLEQAVAAKEFREDLFYRLNVVRIHMPPLRERRPDIRLLVNYFLKKYALNQKQAPKSIQTEAVIALENYNWPGNVRELENVIQRALVVAKGDSILLADLPVEIIKGSAETATANAGASAAPAPSAPAATAEVTANTDMTSVSKLLFDWARKSNDLKVIPAVERELIIHALTETRGNQVQAAKLLGITRATLRKRLEKFKIKQELSIH